MSDYIDTREGFYEAIADRISKRAEWDGDCLVMNGKREHNGQVRISVQRQTTGAHRFAWMLYHREPIPGGLVIRHTCDNPPCVARGHLLLGTQAENMQDMVDRQRFYSPVRDGECRAGHPRTLENTRTYSNGRRECLECERSRSATREQTPYAHRADARRRASDNKQPGRNYVGRI